MAEFQSSPAPAAPKQWAVWIPSCPKGQMDSNGNSSEDFQKASVLRSCRSSFILRGMLLQIGYFFAKTNAKKNNFNKLQVSFFRVLWVQNLSTFLLCCHVTDAFHRDRLVRFHGSTPQVLAEPKGLTAGLRWAVGPLKKNVKNKKSGLQSANLNKYHSNKSISKHFLGNQLKHLKNKLMCYPQQLGRSWKVFVPEPSGTLSAMCTGQLSNFVCYLHRNHPELHGHLHRDPPNLISHPEPSRTWPFETSSGICIGTLRNFVCYVHRTAQQLCLLSAPEPSGTSRAICTGTLRTWSAIRNPPASHQPSTPEPSRTSSAFCPEPSAPEPFGTLPAIYTRNLRNFISFLPRNPPEPHQPSAPEPSGTLSAICTGTLRNLLRNPVLQLHRIAPELFWAKDPIASFAVGENYIHQHRPQTATNHVSTTFMRNKEFIGCPIPEKRNERKEGRQTPEPQPGPRRSQKITMEHNPLPGHVDGTECQNSRETIPGTQAGTRKWRWNRMPED